MRGCSSRMFGVICRRNWALRLSIVLNVCVLLYVCAHFGAVSGPWIEEGAAGGASNWAANPNSIAASSAQDTQLLQQEGTQPRANATATSTSTAAGSGEVKTAAAQVDGKLEGKLEKTNSNAVDFKGNETKLVESNAVEEKKVNLTVGSFDICLYNVYILLCALLGTLIYEKKNRFSNLR